MNTTIQVDVHLKDKLDHLKTNRRETYNDVIRRLVEEPQDAQETIELLGDPDAMMEIARSLAYFKHSRGSDLRGVMKDLRL